MDETVIPNVALPGGVIIRVERVWSKARVWIRQTLCGLNGHTYVADFSDPRVWRDSCIACKRQQPGIPIGDRKYHLVVAGDRNRHRLVK